MSSPYSSQQPSQSPNIQQQYPPRYPTNPQGSQYQSRGFPPQGNYSPQYNTSGNQYPASGNPYQAQYPPQYPAQPQQSGYNMPPNPYQNFSQRNAPYPPYQNQQAYPPVDEFQNPPPQYNPPSSTMPPPPIPQNSPLYRHGLSQVVQSIRKNLSQFPPQFQQKFKQNQSFKSLNRKMVFIPSILMMGHVLLNRNKKWFRLTVNASLIRYSLIGLLMLHISSNVLYVAAYRDMIARNRDKVEKVIVRQEFLGSGSGQ